MIVSEGLAFYCPAVFYQSVVDPGLILLYTYSPETEFDNDFIEHGVKQPEKSCRLRYATPAKPMTAKPAPNPKASIELNDRVNIKCAADSSRKE
jgi:hypothetical protein